MKIAFLLCLSLLCLTARAGQYFQDFSSAAVGATTFTDGSILYSTVDSNTAGVVDATLKELRLTAAGVSETLSAYLLPDLDPSTQVHAFSAKWDAVIAANIPNSADGYSFNFGDFTGINFITNSYAPESGYNVGLSFGVQTYVNNSPGFYLRANGAILASVTNYPGTVWGTNSTIRHFFEVDWHYLNGMSVRMDGQTIFSNVAVTGFAPRRGNRFLWAARAGGLNQTVQLDNLTVITGGNLNQIPTMAPYFTTQTNPPHEADKAFDGDDVSYWTVFHPTGFVGSAISASTNVLVYALTAAATGGGTLPDPRYWMLEGSVNGSTWVSCGSGTGYFSTNRPETRSWFASNANSFAYYRLNVQSNVAAGSVALSELRLYSFTPVTGPEFLYIPQAGMPNIGSSDVAWGDYDNDGRLDILMIGDSYGNYLVQVWHNLGGGRFAQINNTNFPSIVNGGVAWGDYDNDSDLDFAVSGTAAFPNNYGQVHLFRNDGGGTFIRNSVTNFAAFYNGPIAWFDYNRDGRLDLLCSGRVRDPTGYYGANTHLYHNNGNGTFSLVSSSGLTDLDDGNFAIADYDNDGYQDVLMSGLIGGNRSTQVFRNQTNGTFAGQSNPGYPPLSEAGATWGDVNNDTNFDFAVAGRKYDPIEDWMSIWTNNPVNHSFNNLLLVSGAQAGGQGANAAWGDYDSDGFADLLVSGATVSTLQLFRNNGNSTFTVNANLTAPRSSHGAQAWGDFDNDGMLDFITTGYLSSSDPYTAIYHRNGINSNVPPSAVTFISTFPPNGTSVRIAWTQPLTTGTTPLGGLTYNLRIGTTPGGSDILNPMSSTSGLRRIAAYGNMSKARVVTLRLPLGTYYANVQAVDASFAGGPFTFETSFSITNGASTPSVTTTPATAIGAYSATLNASVTPNGIASVAWFQWGLTTNYGNQTVARNVGNHVTATTTSSNLNGLAAATVYHFRAVATNSLGIVYGSNQTFTTHALTALESWRNLYFGTTNNAGSGANTNDAEGDGDANLLEFASGTNPNITNTSPLFRVEISNGLPVIYYYKDINANGIVTWTIESASDLLYIWSNRNGSLQEVESNASIRTIRFDPSVPVPTNESYRLKVMLP